jgi:hypothetical protein
MVISASFNAQGPAVAGHSVRDSDGHLLASFILETGPSKAIDFLGLTFRMLF